MRPDLMETEYIFTHPYGVTLGTRSDWCGDNLPERSRGQMTWYTDGSKTGSGTGFGVYRKNPRTHINRSLGAYSTVFQAEVFAILTCAQRCLEEGLLDILILSDSQAVLKALTKRLRHLHFMQNLR